MDIKKIENLIKDLLMEIEGIENWDKARKGIIETPYRVAKMYTEIFNGYNNTDDDKLIKIFKLENSNSELIISKDIKFFSLCEHHMLPFYGKVDIAYLSDNSKVIGISKLSRIVDKFSNRLNIQEQMTNDICKFITNSKLKPKGVMVMAEAIHLCEVMRGVKKDDVKMITSSASGEVIDNFKLRNEILSLVR